MAILTRRTLLSGAATAAGAMAAAPAAKAGTPAKLPAVMADADDLAPRERLLLRLRYGRGVTLAQLATMFGYRDLQTADRRVRELLIRLRRQLDDPM